jgi:hypothetical protein
VREDLRAFRDRQREILEELPWLVTGVVFATVFLNLLVIGSLVARFVFDAPAAPWVGILGWASVAQYGHLVLRAVQVPLRRATDPLRPARGQYIAERGGHLYVSVWGFALGVIWLFMGVITGIGSETVLWGALTVGAVAALWLLSLAAALRAVLVWNTRTRPVWDTLPDGAEDAARW